MVESRSLPVIFSRDVVTPELLNATLSQPRHTRTLSLPLPTWGRWEGLLTSLLVRPPHDVDRYK